MKYDFNAIVRGFDGAPIEQSVHKTAANGVHVTDERGNLVFERIEPMLLKKFLFDLLGGRLRGDDGLSGSELMGRYSVAQKIAAAGAGAVELGAEDVKTLIGVLEKGASPLIYGMAKSVLDNPIADAALAG